MVCHVKMRIDFESVAQAEKIIGYFISLQGYETVPASGQLAHLLAGDWHRLRSMIRVLSSLYGVIDVEIQTRG